MKELEILRLIKKKSESFGPKPDAANTSQNSSTYVRVPMPSNSFGHSVGTFSQVHLKKMYNELWYNTPQNISNMKIIHLYCKCVRQQLRDSLLKNN